MAALIPKKTLNIKDYQSLIEAIRVAESPISIDSNHGWAIYRSEWAGQLLSDPEQIKGFKFWIDHEETQKVHPVNCAEDIALIIGETIECPFRWSIETTEGENWMETDTSDFQIAAEKASAQWRDMAIISLTLDT